MVSEEVQTLAFVTVKIKSNNLGEKESLVTQYRAYIGMEKVDRDEWFEWDTRNIRRQKKLTKAND